LKYLVTGEAMDKHLHFSQIILKKHEICPYAEECDFRETPERCYGAVDRDNEFVCNLDVLRMMYQSNQ
jgi:hypothetical protein